MNYLIDTQILIWYQLNSNNLHKSNYDLLTDGKSNIFVSQISLFEIAIKQKIGKLPELDLSINDLAVLIERDDFNLLSLQTSISWRIPKFLFYSVIVIRLIDSYWQLL